MEHIKLFEEYNDEDLNRVLDKISKNGIDSLNPDEKGYLTNYGTNKESDYVLNDEENINDLTQELLSTYNHFPNADKKKLNVFSVRPKVDGAYIIAEINSDSIRKVFRGMIKQIGNEYTLNGTAEVISGNTKSEEDTGEFVVKNYDIKNKESKTISITFSSIVKLVAFIVEL